MNGSSRDLPLVAIVTPVYNGERFLAETMECVQAQTYPHLVHVVLDNASTDGTAEIIERFHGGRVPLLVRRNLEVLDQRSNWEMAVRLVPEEAAYFQLLCADDLIAPEAMDAMVALAERDPSVGIVGCLWKTGTHPATAERCRSRLPTGVSVFDGHWFVKSYLLQMHFGTSPQCQLFRRSVLDEVEHLYVYEEMLGDVDACLNTALRWRYGFVHEVLGFTRTHPDSRTAVMNAPTKMFEANWLALIDRYGPKVMTKEELRLCRAAYLRYYWRRMLIWRFKDRDVSLYRRHFDLLKMQDHAPRLTDFCAAIIEWTGLLLLNRRSEVSTAKRLWPQTWAELQRTR